MSASPIRIGMLGAGQLARMMALEGMPLGCEFSIYDTSGAPSAGIGTLYSDPENDQAHLQEFLDSVDVVTYEFEHLPLDLARNIKSRKPLHPNVRSLATCQDREKEKNLFSELGIPTPRWRMARSAEELREACEALGTPVVAKSATEGYDGKGQAVIRSPADAEAAWTQIGHDRLIVEAFVNFTRELSLIAVRSSQGELAYYPLVENHHHEGILRYTWAPAPGVSAAVEAAADDYIARLLNELDYVGALALELFETPDGLLANEMAPRVHNSGHWTQNGAATSQFENHIRAVAGLPLGSTALTRPSCMINLIGAEVDRERLLTLPDTYLHLYNKSIRPGRKVGHVNVTADNASAIHDKVKAVINCVSDCAPYPER